MNLRISSTVTALTAALVLSSTAPAEQGRYPKSAEELARALAGRTAGMPVRCISDRAKMHVVDDWTILYRDRGTVYVQRPRGGCHDLSNSMSLIRNQFVTTRLCTGDINRVVDLRTGFGTGACVFDKFVPYRKPS